MSDFLIIMGKVQNGGGIMIALIYLASEVRNLKHDFLKHEEIFHHEPKKMK